MIACSFDRTPFLLIISGSPGVTSEWELSICSGKQSDARTLRSKIATVIAASCDQVRRQHRIGIVGR